MQAGTKVYTVNAQVLLEGCLSIVSRGYIAICRRYTLLMQGFKRMNPFCIPFAITNMPGAILAMDLGFMGPNYSISTACATGNYCILRWDGGTHLAAASTRQQCSRGIVKLCLPLRQWACPACCKKAQGISRAWVRHFDASCLCIDAHGNLSETRRRALLQDEAACRELKHTNALQRCGACQERGCRSDAGGRRGRGYHPLRHGRLHSVQSAVQEE